MIARRSDRCPWSVDLFMCWRVHVKSGQSGLPAVDGSWSPAPAGCRRNRGSNWTPCSRHKRLRRCRTCRVSCREWRRLPGRWGNTLRRGRRRSSRNHRRPQHCDRTRYTDSTTSYTWGRRRRNTHTSRAAIARAVSWRRKEEHVCVRQHACLT